MTKNWDLGSAVTVRLGIAAGAILGGLACYWIGGANAPVGQGPPAWAIGLGGVAGLAVAWAVLTWLAKKHRGAGVIAGGVLTAAAVLALLARFVW